MKSYLKPLKSYKAIYTLTVTVILLSLIITSSFAWIAYSRKTNASDITMGLAVDDTNAEFEAYIYSMESESGINSIDGQKLTLTNLVLNRYDTIFRAQNIKTPAFSKITITRHDMMPKSGTLYITINRRANENQTEPLPPVTSSIIRFTTFIVRDHSDVNITDADELYNAINTTQRFDDVEEIKGNATPESQTFVTITKNGEETTYNKADTVVLSLNYSDTDWYKADGLDLLNVYVYITYDVELVKSYIAEKDNGRISLDDNIVKFTNDLRKISISYEKDSE